MTELTGRSPMKSPGKPSLRRDVERSFWRKVAEGLSSEEAALCSRSVVQLSTMRSRFIGLASAVNEPVLWGMFASAVIRSVPEL